MRTTENLAAAAQLLERYRRRRALKVRAPGLHVSDLVGCSRKAWYGQNVESTFLEDDDFTLITLLGQGHHVLLEGSVEEAFEIGGLSFTPDELFKGDELEPRTEPIVVEYKTTRKSAKAAMEGAGPWAHENYIDQLGSYAALTGSRHGRLHVFYLLGKYSPPFPIHKCWDFEFEESELSAWVKELARRKQMIDMATHIAAIPIQEHYGEKDWECDWCPLKGNVCPGGEGERRLFFLESFD